MFDIELGKVIESVMEDAKKLKEDKDNVASMTDRFNKQLYYVLTEEQFDLMFKNKKPTQTREEVNK